MVKGKQIVSRRNSSSLYFEVARTSKPIHYRVMGQNVKSPTFLRAGGSIAVFAHSRPVRALFSNAGSVARRFSHRFALGFALVRAGSRDIAHCSQCLHYSQEFTLFARYSHYISGLFSSKTKSIRAVFARCSHSIRTRSHVFAPWSPTGHIVFANIGNSSRRVASIHIL